MIGLSRGWAERLTALGRTAEQDLFVCSPFIRVEGVNLLVKSLSESFRSCGSLTLLTDLSPLNVCQSLIAPEALLSFFDVTSVFRICHLPRIHAKVYVADLRVAIVTSGTAGGLFRNYEYGIETNRSDEVQLIRGDIAAYARLGTVVDRSQLEAYSEIGKELVSAFRAQQATVAKSRQRQFQRRLHEAEDQLVGLRVRGGAMTTAFERTIEYLLEREGPLTTRELHPRIQAMHPDLCDDAVDRIIDGVRFGKRWKHVARSAQSHLKQRDTIELDAGRWRLSSMS
ncbi:MAG: hypothetical protein H0T47_20840 [Planctomycetaceae bacterium]|nr:hypothetical protein [Planctomycetaceae bacterium]